MNGSEEATAACLRNGADIHERYSWIVRYQNANQMLDVEIQRAFLIA